MFGLPESILSAMLIFAAGVPQGSDGPMCKPAGALMPLPALPEASGIAIDRMGSRIWMHNDSGAPELIALDPRGVVAGRLRLDGARVEDWEALASGPCGKGSCLFVGDIGDNDASRKQITVYRLPEPAQPNGSAKVDTFHASYPDGPHDAETLIVAPDGTLLIVTKGDTGPVAVYKFPRDLQAGSTVKLERVGKAIAERPGDTARVTDGVFSGDGKWVVLRTNTALTFYRGEDFLRGEFREARRVDVSMIKEPQGEAVAFGSGNTVYLGGEGGSKKQPGTLAALSCEP